MLTVSISFGLNCCLLYLSRFRVVPPRRRISSVYPQAYSKYHLEQLTEFAISVNLIRTDLANTAWSPSAAESQIQLHLPTACLRRLTLLAFFSSINGSHNLVEDGSLYADKLGTEEVCGTTQEGIGRGRESPLRSKDFYISGTKGHSALQFLSLVDTAFMSLLKDTLGRIAPCIFSPGYLEVCQNAGCYDSSGKMTYIIAISMAA